MEDLFEEIEKLTIELINIPSINNSIGERNICNRISEYINNIEYFKEHKEYTFQVSLNEDPYRRVNVFALLRGEGGFSNKTVILHGHVDTVGIENFGGLAEYAFDSKSLNEKLKELDLPKEIKNDLHSGDWIFGRGAADMKSGVAVHLVILKELSKNIKNFSGNILFMANPVEENQHTGIIEAFATFIYFNYFVHNSSVNKIINNLKNIAEKSFGEVISKVNTEYEKFCKLTKEEYSPLPWKSNVITYKELYEEVKNGHGCKVDEEISNLTKTLTKQGMDRREICLNIVEKLWRLSNNREPSIVIFFAPPYCPHNTLKIKDKNERNVIEKIEECVEEISRKSNEEFKILQFFPSLSDSSYLKIDDNFNSLKNLMDNFPNWKEIYNIPVDNIKKLDIPSVNYGCYGKDAHKWTERVCKPYSFNILPRLILTTVYKFLHETR
ncbi:M20/M25/M40 family metallo-hydrolase [Clostridium kluyveri]|uniref:Peptidase M20 n=1 Tax=Clostridium kluyveri TaxID=1534 RepID=A0A1L5F591_CLOKL|nr:M20/M25/M40 family metallo-hydrolase [Clostridium kluyveri]APM38122.1 peptidase M20 [Clostridium kluyveri]UZQ51868.1 M20/M25/M40 family metallo-hydrolase [Clostridium kluyveri]